MFLLFGIIFIIIGGVIQVQSEKVQEKVIVYGGSKEDKPECGPVAEGFKYQYTKDDFEVKKDTCTVKIDIEDKMEKPVYVYYQVDNFYQNHRRYVKSYDWRQLMNNLKDGETTILK